VNSKASFSEDDIRPQVFNHLKAKATLKDIEFLLQNKSSFVDINCPVCESEGFFVFEKNGFSYQSCHNCKTFFVSPRPTDTLLGDFYRQSSVYEFWNDYIFPNSEAARIEKIFKPRVSRILDICRKHLISHESFLEIGAGFGSFSYELSIHHYFKDIFCLELTPSLANTCRNKGLKVFESSYEGFITQHTFDCIASFETIEHLFSPISFVKKCYDLLSSNGLLVLSSPNYYGFDIQVLQSASSSIDHEHINLLNPMSSKLLLESCGFTVIDIFTPGVIDVDIVRNKVLHGAFNVTDPFLSYIVNDAPPSVVDSFQSFLVANNLSSHMWIVGKKV